MYGVENDQTKLEKIQDGEPSFHEEGLVPLLKENLGKNFIVGNSVRHAVQNSRITMVCVGTPTVDGKIDLSGVLEALREIVREACILGKYHVVVIKSTVVPNSTDTILRNFLEEEFKIKIGEDIGLCVNPEFLREGSAVQIF